jgi:transcriptional pleiotropic regulator of transition state genes
MKSTGIVRRIDGLGRIVIPKELRTTAGIDCGDPMEIFTDADGAVIIRPYRPGCTFCNSMDDLITVGNVTMCRKCARAIAEQAG